MERPDYDPTIVAAIGDPGWLAAAPDEGETPLAIGAKIYLAIDAAIRALRDDVEALRASGRFSPSGLAVEIAELGRARAAELDDIGTRIEALRARRDAALAADAETGGPGDRAPLIARVWDWLPRDNPALFAAYLSAIEAGDALTVEAVETLPRFLPFALTDAQREEGKGLQLVRSDPARAAALDEIDRVIADLDTALMGARREVGRLAGTQALADAA